MNTSKSATAKAIELFRSVVEEKRYIQNAWNKTIDGKQYVCLAAAWGKPGTIHSTSDCPSSLFPQWVFELMPTLDDGVAASDVGWLFESFADRAERMAALSPAQWDNLRTSFLIGVIDVALDAARPVQPNPLPDYWTKVEAACAQVQSALKGDGDIQAWAARAAAAEAAAWAARAAAAEAAAEAARAAAAEAAAEAARAAAAEAAAEAARAAWAAARAAWAAWAAARAEAARAAWAAMATASAARAAAAALDTYKQIASVFFACVDEQLKEAL